MKNLLRTDVLQRAIDRAIHLQPIHVQVWSVVSGDGIMSPQSYGMTASYVGAIADTGKQVYKDFFDKGSVSGKNFVVILPYDGTKPIPQKNQSMILYDTNGNEMSRVWVIFVTTYSSGTLNNSQNGIYKIECIVEVRET